MVSVFVISDHVRGNVSSSHATATTGADITGTWVGHVDAHRGNIQPLTSGMPLREVGTAQPSELLEPSRPIANTERKENQMPSHSSFTNR